MVGIFSATGTLASATVAFLLYRNSVRGAQITLSLEDLVESPTHVVTYSISSATEYYEEMGLRFPIVFANSGPRGGAITDARIILLAPPPERATINNGVASSDIIDVGFTMGQYVFQPTFTSGRQDVIAIKDHETLAFVVNLSLRLKDRESQVRPPSMTFAQIQTEYPYFKFKLFYKVTGEKGKIMSRDATMTVRPKFIP